AIRGSHLSDRTTAASSTWAAPRGWHSPAWHLFLDRGMSIFKKLLHSRRLQSLVAQVQLVHDLVVLIARCLAGIATERVRVGALEVDDLAALLVEEGVLRGVVEIHLVVRDDSLGLHPRA